MKLPFLDTIHPQSNTFVMSVNIVNRGDWFVSPENFNGVNKESKIYLGRSATVHNLLFIHNA